MIEFISQPWHWSVSGVMIVVVMLLLTYSGGRFGVSSNLQTICAMGGAGKFSEYFRIDWKANIWNLVFIGASVLGGFIASQYLTSPDPVAISENTQGYLQTIGVTTPQSIAEGTGFVPSEIFQDLSKPINLVLLIVGGILIGFGTRYAGGCTSGHAISGLANLQVASLIAVVGFQIAKRLKMKTIAGNEPKYVIKEGSVFRLIVGGTIFGLGWAVTGACPGPMFVLVGHGVWSILIVIASSLVGTFLYGLVKKKLPH